MLNITAEDLSSENKNVDWGNESDNTYEKAELLRLSLRARIQKQPVIDGALARLRLRFRSIKSPDCAIETTTDGSQSDSRFLCVVVAVRSEFHHYIAFPFARRILPRRLRHKSFASVDDRLRFRLSRCNRKTNKHKIIRLVSLTKGEKKKKHSQHSSWFIFSFSLFRFEREAIGFSQRWLIAMPSSLFKSFKISGLWERVHASTSSIALRHSKAIFYAT